MGNCLWFLVFFSSLMATSRACKSRSSVSDKYPVIVPTSTTPNSDDYYFDYAIHGNMDPVAEGPKVINASLEVTPGDFPHQVSLQATNEQNRHFCSASIIHPKFLLTAAHCFRGNYRIRNVRAVSGEHDLKASGGNKGQIRRVTRVIKHENYNDQTHDNDIALLELNERLHFDNRYVSPITLWDSALRLPEWANVSGWGMDSSGSSSERLMAAVVKIRDQYSCRESLRSTSFTPTSNMICASALRDDCSVDSGGPLTCSKNVANGQRHHYLCGIVSYDMDCHGTNNGSHHSVYTDVTKYKDWIQRVLPPTIYFGAKGGEGISAYSESERTNHTIIRGAEDPEGLTFNWINGKFYYTGANKIYSADEDGTNVQKVFESTQYGTIKGLAFDWITGNLYGVSQKGFVFVCKIQANGQLSCTGLLRGQGNLLGIALDPNNGQMYWTRGPDKIMRSQMDGTSAVQVLTGLGHPVGITIDFDESRLLWSEYGAHRICSSALDGTDIFVVANNDTDDGKLPVRYPWGIAVNNDSVYWGNFLDKSLQRASKWGSAIEILLTDQGHIQQLTTTQWNVAITRPNDCEVQNCEHICVLTASSYRCVR